MISGLTNKILVKKNSLQYSRDDLDDNNDDERMWIMIELCLIL